MAGGKIDILISPETKNFPREMESGLQGALGTATRIGSAIGIALGGAATVKAIADIGRDFESEMNSLAAVSQASASQLAEVEVRARELGKALTATSSSDAAAAMTALVKGGFDVDQSMGAARGTLELAAAAQIDAATAAQIQAQALNSFSLEADYASIAADVLAGAANASAADITGISNGLAQSSAVASQFGLTLEDNATAMAIFANAGIQGSDAGTLLKTSLLSMTKDSKSARGAMEELGLQTYNAAGEFVGMESLFGQLSDAQERMTDEQYQAASAALFGSDAMRLSGIAAREGSKGWNETYDAVTRAGQASEVAAAQTQGIPGIMGAIGNQAEDTALAIYSSFSGLAVQGGEALVGVFETIAPVIEDTTQRMASTLESGIGMASGLAESYGGLIGPVVAAGAAVAGANWLRLPDRLNAGTGSLQSFGRAMQTQQSLATLAGQKIGVMGSAVAALESRSPGVARLASTFRDASSTGRIMGQETRLASREMTGFASVATRAQGSLQSFGGVARGVATGGMSLLSSGARGLMGVLGGPWGTAFLAAGAMVGHLMQKHQEAAAAEREHKASQEELRGTLDQTTGAITEQTEALVAKRAEEQGWTQAATDLGLSQTTVVEAMQGSERAIREVDAAVLAQSTAVVESSDYWQKWGGLLTEHGVSAGDLAGRLHGSAEATDRHVRAMQGINKIDPNLLAGERLDWIKASDAIGETTEEFWSLRDGVVGASDEMAEVQTELLRRRLNALSDQVEQTQGAMEILGDTVFTMEDEKTISVSADEVTTQTRELLEEIGVEVSQPQNGIVTVVFPDGVDIIGMLDHIGIQLSHMEGGFIEVDAQDVEAAELALAELGLATTRLDSGELVIDTNLDDVLDKLVDFGLAEKNAAGRIEIDFQALLDSDERMKVLRENIAAGADGEARFTDNTDETKANVDSMRENVAAGADGEARMSDNAAEVSANVDRELDGKVTRGRHIVFSEFAAATASGYGRTASGSLPSTMADGGVRISDQDAQMARGGDWLMWAEDETEGESFIPHAAGKRPRSTQILVETAGLFGLGVVDAQGRPVGRDGSPVGPTGTTATFADGAVRESGIDRAHRLLDHTSGGPYVWGGASTAGSDCSGYVALWQNILEGREPWQSRLGTTVSLLAGQWPSLRPGSGGAFLVGVTPEHMVASLDGVAIEAGNSGMQVGSGATPPRSLPGAALYYLPDDLIVGGAEGTTSRRRSSRSDDDGLSAEERERIREEQRLEDMAEESHMRLASASASLPPDPIVSSLSTAETDPSGLRALTRGGQWTPRFEATHHAPADDPLTDFLLWAWGNEGKADFELARAFNADNDSSGVRALTEAGVWTERFGAHYGAGLDSDLVRAVQAARDNGGYYTVKLQSLDDELSSMPSSWSELAGNAASVAASSLVSDITGALGHDDDFGPLVSAASIIVREAARQDTALDATGQSVGQAIAGQRPTDQRTAAAPPVATDWAITPEALAAVTAGATPWVMPFAQGGLLDSTKSQVIPPNTFRMIGDRPAGDEFFLPDDDSSLGMGAEWARRRGFELIRTHHDAARPTPTRGEVGAPAPAASRPIHINARGYDRADLSAAMRQARHEERWEGGFR